MQDAGWRGPADTEGRASPKPQLRLVRRGQRVESQRRLGADGEPETIREKNRETPRTDENLNSRAQTECWRMDEVLERWKKEGERCKRCKAPVQGVDRKEAG